VNGSDIAIYEAEGGQTQLQVRLVRERVWITQAQMVELFNQDVSAISRHIRNVCAEGELDEPSNVQKTQIAGSDKPATFYNLDVIISAGAAVPTAAQERRRG
jgi:hypothetical protein